MLLSCKQSASKLFSLPTIYRSAVAAVIPLIELKSIAFLMSLNPDCSSLDIAKPRDNKVLQRSALVIMRMLGLSMAAL